MDYRNWRRMSFQELLFNARSRGKRISEREPRRESRRHQMAHIVDVVFLNDFSAIIQHKNLFDSPVWLVVPPHFSIVSHKFLKGPLSQMREKGLSPVSSFQRLMQPLLVLLYET
jgi:hypothetical protein